MDNALTLQTARKDASGIGWALLIYTLLMNVVVMIFAFVDAIILSFQYAMSGNMDVDAMAEQITERLLSNGTGYILTIALGYLFLRLWKGKKFCRETLWQPGKPMTAGAFAALVCFFISGQLLFQYMAPAMEWYFGLFGFSVMEAIETATIESDTLSMFLYAGVFAPIAEEIIFRGLVLRVLQPCGKRYAILLSAFLFGIFHGNVVQSPFAFVVGIVLGYTALEYNIGWAMLLHMINNLVLADMLTRLTSSLPTAVSDGIFYLLIWVCFIAAVVIAVINRDKIKAYIRENRVNNTCIKGFFTAPGIICLTVFMWLNVLLTFAMQLLV